MTGEPTITITGNLAADPELRFTPSGQAVANFTVASTPRTFDKASNEWKDGETLWMRCAAWRDMAENVAESLSKGTRVIVTGRLTSRQYEKDGQTRTAIEMTVDEVGPSMRYATARVTKADRSQGGNAQQQAEFGGQAAAWGPPQQQQQGANPWATPVPGAPAWGAPPPPNSQQPPALQGPPPQQPPQGQPQGAPGGWTPPPTEEPPY